MDNKQSNDKNGLDGKKKKLEKPKRRVSLWPLKIFVLTFFLAIFFGVSSELMLSDAGIVLSILIILLFITIAVIADMIGVAVTAASFENINAMASRRVRGAKESVMILSHSEKFASLCNDVIGDVCGTICGAAGGAIGFKILESVSTIGISQKILIAALISGVIASLTVFSKALGKSYAMQKSEAIVLKVGVVFSLFGGKKK